MESTSNERLNVLGAAAIGVIVLGFFIHAVITVPVLLVGAIFVAIALGALALLKNEPGRELGFVAIVLALVSIFTL